FSSFSGGEISPPGRGVRKAIFHAGLCLGKLLAENRGSGEQVSGEVWVRVGRARAQSCSGGEAVSRANRIVRVRRLYQQDHRPRRWGEDREAQRDCVRCLSASHKKRRSEG